MSTESFWSKSKTGTLVVWDRKSSNNPKCPYKKLGCQGKLFFAEKPLAPQVFCDWCGAVYPNPMKLGLDELSKHKISKSDEAWWWRLVATKKLSLPVKKPSLLRRAWLTVRWYL